MKTLSNFGEVDGPKVPATFSLHGSFEDMVLALAAEDTSRACQCLNKCRQGHGDEVFLLMVGNCGNCS